MKIKFEFNVRTRYVGSNVVEEMELEFDDDATEKEIEQQVEQAWIDWRNQEAEGGWKRLDGK